MTVWHPCFENVEAGLVVIILFGVYKRIIMAWCHQDDENEFDDDYIDWSDDDNIVCNSKYVVSSSSDEDGDKFLERIKSRKLTKKVQASKGKDDFEKEMASELSMTMQQLTASICKKPLETTASASVTDEAGASASPEKPPEFYDEIYFDSDDSDGEGMPSEFSAAQKPSASNKRKNNRRVLTNDELFYDPTMDDRDQEWMDKMRRSYQVKSKNRPPGTSQTSQKPLPESDAVLNCPACLTMLCMDCQRHEIYHNQYRAMFVFNCNVNWTEVLKFPKKNQKKKEYFKNKKKLKKSQPEPEENLQTQELKKENAEQEMPSSDGDALHEECRISTENTAKAEVDRMGSGAVARAKVSGNDSEELFHPVTCKICNTKVAVYDKDEVYHFFNIVTSY